MTPPRLPRPSWENFLRGLGVAGVIYETVLGSAATERPTLLLLFAAMIGLPSFLNKDTKALDAVPPASPPTPAKEPETP